MMSSTNGLHICNLVFELERLFWSWLTTHVLSLWSLWLRQMDFHFQVKTGPNPFEGIEQHSTVICVGYKCMQ